MHFFATTSRGLEPVLQRELRRIGAKDPRRSRGGVSFSGGLEAGYRSVLWSRVANRVLLSLGQLGAATADQLYRNVKQIPWEQHLYPGSTLAVDFIGANDEIRHGNFGAQKVKDAVVDRLRDLTGKRPSVDRHNPDLRINVHLSGRQAQVAVDLSGDSQHRRGYRQEGVMAPLKETLGAGLLLLAGWDRIGPNGGPFLDPMCGSGTLLIEAAWIAGDHAPGLLRNRFGLHGWRGHDSRLWDGLVDEARSRWEKGRTTLPSIIGIDLDPTAVRATEANLKRCGLDGVVKVIRGDLRFKEGMTVVPEEPAGLLLSNPPYGERLEQELSASALHRWFTSLLAKKLGGWRGGLILPKGESRFNAENGRSYDLFNGRIACHLWLVGDEPGPRRREKKPTAKSRDAVTSRDARGADASGRDVRGREVWKKQRSAATESSREEADDVPRVDLPPIDLTGGSTVSGTGGEMLANRLRKNLKHLRRWAKREQVSCFRVYDADLPEYAVAVDLYGDWVHVQEYQAPSSIDPLLARKRLQEAVHVIPEALGLGRDRLRLKVRRRGRGGQQYEKIQDSGAFQEVEEGGLRFRINLTDYLDSGLFLDHRLVRGWVREWAAGRDFLNLFGYTGSATVYAADGVAASTTTVDLSNTYLEWARANMQQNGFDQPHHRYVRDDVLGWMKREKRRYGLILLDPPTFSNSRKMNRELDISRDHVALIRSAASLLVPDGLLIFSCNFRKFRLDEEQLSRDFELEDRSRASIPPDFGRRGNIHTCWWIQRRG
ncbi:MAG: bifunctional 23S rRNA (guanine(2069)-N(7))-methyltransferase RlmK/23S rRNA (guanine(2445)-N(2))-methyltransferase RlmL [Magnetococcales bacterium]|nr:bifunctional 23S rRNA (guanine(2069)-N(7))-methyltransferase RlmK/23S rRNA (guanine(2445)-N(2))-methyltransferase RlmL [Magnetococcales bacterium]